MVGRSTSPVRGSFEAKASEVRARVKRYTKGFKQAYSAGIGEDMYGRLLTEAPGERGAKNRYISQEWHQFLQFPSVSQGPKKPPPSLYDEASRTMQIQRHRQMRHANIHRRGT
jgi:hypothetical protein